MGHWKKKSHVPHSEKEYTKHVIGTTLLPRKGSPYYREPYKGEMSQKIREGCSLKDRLHPNKRGGKILADAVELKELIN